MRKVTAWMTDDSKVFESREDALKHEQYLELRSMLREEGVGSGGDWNQEMFLRFLVDNMPRLNRIFNMVNLESE